jgi:exodeoxyribonuclease V alpha subunit
MNDGTKPGARSADRPPLSPRGTARQRLAPLAAYPAELAAELRDTDADAERGSEALTLAWQVAEWVADPAARAALLPLFARTLAAVAQGSTRLPVDASGRALLAAAGAVVGRPGERRPFILDGDHLYPERLLASEDRLVASLAARLRRPPLFAREDVDRVIAVVAAAATPEPSPEQRAAVRAAVQGRFAVITGGPGTGKTSVVVSLVRTLIGLGVAPEAIALAAPTGKAANRLQEALAAHPLADGARTLKAETLHRLLGYLPRAGAFVRGAHHRLAQRAVIVDEGSMIDLLLMERLAAAVADDALLVILGDADQLPSVQAGAVFRDLAALVVDARALPGVRLTRSFRLDPAQGEGRQILELGRAVRTGEATALDALFAVRSSAGSLAFAGAELAPAAALPGLLERWYSERVAALPDFSRLAFDVYRLGEDGLSAADEARLEILHRHYQSFRLLCLTRGRPTGVESCNAWLHRRHDPGASTFAPGEPILMLRNDYDRGLFNGDQGVVVSVREGGRPPRAMALFPVARESDAGSEPAPAPAQRWSAFDLDSLRDTLEHAYAMTVHKAQGSEYQDVVLVLPDVPIPLLSRELLYTALSRSRRAVVVCGSPAVLAAGIARPLLRSSGVADKLSAALSSGTGVALGPNDPVSRALRGEGE